MRVTPYLNFDGECEAAFKFYEQVLGARIEALTIHGDSPVGDQGSPAWRGRVIHARLILGDQVLMASDSPPDQYEPPRGIYLSLGIDEPAEAERVFRTLAENGKVTMPLEQTFWAALFGMVVDRYGIHWMVNCERGA